MFARQWHPLGSLEAKQLASEVNRRSLELAAQSLSLALEGFKPDREVGGFLTRHESLLSSLGELSNNVGGTWTYQRAAQALKVKPRPGIGHRRSQVASSHGMDSDFLS